MHAWTSVLATCIVVFEPCTQSLYIPSMVAESDATNIYVCELDIVAPKAHQNNRSYVSLADLPSDSLRKNLAWWAVTRRTSKLSKLWGRHLSGTRQILIAEQQLDRHLVDTHRSEIELLHVNNLHALGGGGNAQLLYS